MSMSNQPIKEQLYPEGTFLYFCNHSEDAYQKTKLKNEATSDFLRAAEKDGLIKPLLVSDELKAGSKDEKISVNFYSPHQIFLVAALNKNIIDEDGFLRNPGDLDWQRQQGFRMVDWGDGRAFNVDLYKNKTEWEETTINPILISNYLHQFLIFIHTYPYKNRYERDAVDKSRSHRNLPNLAFDFGELEIDGEEKLKNFGLDKEQLLHLKRGVGYLAVFFDPLADWYDYVKRHSQKRKDELSGVAALAQDLYNLCDLISEVLELACGEKRKPLRQFLDEGFPVNRPHEEYKHGTDWAAINTAAKMMSDWLSKNTKLLKELKIIQADLVKRLGVIMEEIAEFEKYYSSNVKYVGGILHFTGKTAPPLEKLDPKVRKLFDDMKRQQEKSGHWNEKTVIEFAIEQRLSDIGYVLSDLIIYPTKPMSDRRWELERKKNDTHWWGEFMQSLQNKTTDGVNARNEFWKVFHPKKMKELDEKIAPFKNGEAQLMGIWEISRSAFCANCRKNRVRIYQDYGDSLISDDAVCDECLNNPELNKVMGGEWRCEECDKLLTKFAYNNVLNDFTQYATSQLKIELKYGRIKAVAICSGNEGCGHKNVKFIDWGWRS